MQRKSYLVPFVFLSALMATAGVVRAEARVELELVTEAGFPVTESHRWLAELKDLGFSRLRIRSARPGDKIQVVTRGSGPSGVHHVTGALTVRNALRLPHGTFRRHDTGGIADWVERLKQDGEQGLAAKPAAFGLTGQQLVDVHEQLAVKVTFSTKGKRAGAVVQQIGQHLPLPLAVDPAVAQSLAGDHTVAEELFGVTSGTALAAILRPLGLVWVPNKPRRGDVLLVITDVRTAPESWPVGWPPEKKPRELAPQLFEFLDIEIKDQPLSVAVNAIQQRLDIPFLLDHNSLARHRIEPSHVKVSIPDGRSYYKRILDRVLAQGKLKADVRVDEAGQPIVWISTIKR